MASDGGKDGSPPQVDEARKSHLYQLLVFGGLGGLNNWVLFFGEPLDDTTVKYWALVAGAFLFPLLAIVSWRAYRNGWQPERTDKAVGRLFGWLVASPFVLIAAGLVIWGVVSLAGWFASIPVWAAVIIILLLIRR
jgi:hypothetical protein